MVSSGWGLQGVTHAKTFQMMHSKYEQGQERVPGREGEAAAASEAALQTARRRRDARAMDKGKESSTYTSHVSSILQASHHLVPPPSIAV